MAKIKNPNKDYEDNMRNLIAWLLAITVLMAGTVAASFEKINGFSILLIMAYIVILLLSALFAVLSLLNKNKKNAKLALILFYILLVVWAFYAMLFLIDKFGIKVIMDQISSNITTD